MTVGNRRAGAFILALALALLILSLLVLLTPSKTRQPLPQKPITGVFGELASFVWPLKVTLSVVLQTIKGNDSPPVDAFRMWRRRDGVAQHDWSMRGQERVSNLAFTTGKTSANSRGCLYLYAKSYEVSFLSNTRT
jgi:hypothetical protein